MNIGFAIKELRKNNRINQFDLAKKANISQTALSQIENGKRPGIKTLTQLSEALKVPEPMLYLMAIEEKDIPKSKQMLYKKIYPVIKALIIELAS